MNDQGMIEEYLAYLDQRGYPCVAAKAALKLGQVRCLIADHMACPKDDQQILHFLYDFVDGYRNSKTSFHSAAILFRLPEIINEQMFEPLLWERLSALRYLDRQRHEYDNRVNPDPASANFSFSIKSEAFFVIGIHPASNRNSRVFRYPGLVFNPHAEFEKLRAAKRYEPLKRVVRKRDSKFSGSVNPMLQDFGEASEVFQYSGMNYDSSWKCPLDTYSGTDEHNP
jgi:FPC/CPF motif-containing protein YcgG